MTDYLAAWRAAQAAGHHADCDGSMTLHLGIVEHISTEGTQGGMWQARCRMAELCGWEGSRVGRGALDLARREAREHSREEPCDLRCLL